MLSKVTCFFFLEPSVFWPFASRCMATCRPRQALKPSSHEGELLVATAVQLPSQVAPR